MNCPSCQVENEASASACTRCGATLVMPTSVIVTVDLSSGSLFHGRYEIMGPLGRGGMGMVYKARDKVLDEVVAIKVLRPDFAQDPKMAERFKGEIKNARKIRHRNVCAIHDYGEDRGLLYISMEFIDGVDLKHVLREKGGLESRQAYDVAIQVAEGLQAVHDAGIIHRDLKTPNIMVDAQGVARLMDFGIAKRQGAEGTMTATGQVVGTPEYMSPEQAQGRKVDFRSDIYALGIVTYEIFTGQVPFRGETPISTILKHLHDPPPLEGPAARGISDGLRPVLRKALAKDQTDRYANAREFAEALRHARSPSSRQQPVPTVVLEAPTLQRPRPAHRRALQAWLLGLPVALVAGTLAVLQLRKAPEPTTAVAVGNVPTPLPTAAVVEPTPAATPPAAAVAPHPTTPAEPGSPSPARVMPRATATPLVRMPRATPTPAAQRMVTAPPPAAVVPPPGPATPAPAATPAPPAPTPASLAGLLQVAVRPWGEVSVDGNVIGTTPLDKIALAAGPHTVRVRHPGYEPIERRVAIQPGQPARLVVDFYAEGVKKP
jgi:serine/threonine-protein kinase